jgi:hypothetical protein
MEVTRKVFYILIVVVLAANGWLSQTVSAEERSAELFVGQDLYFSGPEVISYQLSEGEYSLVFERGFSMSIGGNKYSSSKAAVWLKQSGAEIKTTVYLCEEIKIEKSSMAQTTGLQETVLEKDKRVIVELSTSGEIFVTAEKRQTSDNRELEIYKEALAAVSGLPKGPRFVVQERALVPQWPEEKPQEEKVVVEKREEKAVEEAEKPKEEPEVVAVEEKAEKAAPGEPRLPEARRVHYRYPVNLAPAGEAAPKIEKFTLADGT